MRRVFIHDGKVGHVTRHAGQLFKIKRSNLKVKKSRAVSADKNAITRQWMGMFISTSNLMGIIDVWVNACDITRSHGSARVL